MGLGGIALYGIMLAFFGTLAGMIIDCTINISQEILAQGWLRNFNFLTPGGMVSHAKILEEVFFAGGDKNLNVLGLIFSLAWVIYAIALITQLFKLFGDPGSGAKTPAVGSTLVKFAVYAFLLASCYPLLEMILGWYSQLISGIATIGEEMVVQGDWQTNGSSLFSNALDPQWYIFFCILSFGVGTAMIGCMLTYMERYIAMAIYVYLAPLCVAMGVNDETSDVFKKWVMGLIGQMLALALSIVLMGAAYRALSSGVGMGETGLTSVNTPKGETIDMGVRSIRIIMCIVLLGASKNSEKFFNMLGFSTMNFGDAGRTFAAGLATAAMAARALAAPAKAGGKKIDGAMEKMAKRPAHAGKNGEIEASKLSQDATKKGAEAFNNAGKQMQENANTAKVAKDQQKKQAEELSKGVETAAKNRDDAAQQLKDAQTKEQAALAARDRAASNVDNAHKNRTDGEVSNKAEAMAQQNKEAADAKVNAAQERADKAAEAVQNAQDSLNRREQIGGPNGAGVAEAQKTLNAAKEEKKAADANLANALQEQGIADNDVKNLAAYKAANQAYQDRKADAEHAQAHYDELSGKYDSAAAAAKAFSAEQGKELVKDMPELKNSAQIATLMGDMDNNYSYEQKGWAMAENGAACMVVDIKDPRHMNRTVSTVAMQLPGSESLESTAPGSALIDLESGDVVGYTGSSGGTEKAATGINYVNLNDSAPRDYVLQPGESFSAAQTRFEQTKQNNTIAVDTGGLSSVSAFLYGETRSRSEPEEIKPQSHEVNPDDDLTPVPDIKD